MISDKITMVMDTRGLTHRQKKKKKKKKKTKEKKKKKKKNRHLNDHSSEK